MKGKIMYSSQQYGAEIVNFECNIKKKIIREVNVACSEVLVLHRWLEHIVWGPEFLETQKKINLSIVCYVFKMTLIGLFNRSSSPASPRIIWIITSYQC